MQAPLKLVLAALLMSTALLANATEAHHPDDVTPPSAETSSQAQPADNQAMTQQMQKMQAARDIWPPPRPQPSAKRP